MENVNDYTADQPDFTDSHEGLLPPSSSAETGYPVTAGFPPQPSAPELAAAPFTPHPDSSVVMANSGIESPFSASSEVTLTSSMMEYGSDHQYPGTLRSLGSEGRHVVEMVHPEGAGVPGQIHPKGAGMDPFNADTVSHAL